MRPNYVSCASTNTRIRIWDCAKHMRIHSYIHNTCVYSIYIYIYIYIYIHMYLYRCTFYIHAYTCIYISVHSYFYICENTCRNTNTYKHVHVNQCLRVRHTRLQTSKYAPCAQGLFTCTCFMRAVAGHLVPCLVFVDEGSPMRSYLSGCA